MIAIRVNNIGNAYIKMHATGHSTRAVKGNYTKLYLKNSLSPGWSQAFIWTDAEILLIGPLGSNCTEIVIEIITLSFKKIRFKVSSMKRRPFCIGLNVLNNCDDFFIVATHGVQSVQLLVYIICRFRGITQTLQHSIMQLWCYLSFERSFRDTWNCSPRIRLCLLNCAWQVVCQIKKKLWGMY